MRCGSDAGKRTIWDTYHGPKKVRHETQHGIWRVSRARLGPALRWALWQIALALAWPRDANHIDDNEASRAWTTSTAFFLIVHGYFPQLLSLERYLSQFRNSRKLSITHVLCAVLWERKCFIICEALRRSKSNMVSCRWRRAASNVIESACS